MFEDLRSKKLRKISILVMVPAVVFLFIGSFIYSGYKGSMGKVVLNTPPESSKSTSADSMEFPFYELTVPYLRERT